jgi:hypothetical protein
LLYQEQGIKESPTRNVSQIPLSACFHEKEYGTEYAHLRHRTQQMFLSPGLIANRYPKIWTCRKNMQPFLFPRNA